MVVSDKEFLGHGWAFPVREGADADVESVAYEDDVQQAVRLIIGTDTPSVDLFDSKDLPTHLQFLKYDMAILEGLILKDVPEGIYELIALPLKLVDFDASPVRAILRREEGI